LADTKISALTAASAAAAANELAINEAGTSKKVTVAQLLAFAQANGAGNTNADSPNSTIAINVLTGAPATLATKTITFVAGDTCHIRVKGSILNNSGGTKTYAVRISLGTLTADLTWGTTVAASGTNRVPVEIEATFGIKASNSAWMNARFTGSTAAALGTSGAEILVLDQKVVQQAATDQTGSKAVTVAMFSSANNATQSFELISWSVEKVPTNG
jgi:hypothetical protein